MVIGVVYTIIRDKDGREVDFVTQIDGKIIDLIEVKASDTTISTPPWMIL